MMNDANSGNMERANNYTSSEISKILQVVSTMFNKTTYFQNSRVSWELKVLLVCCIAIYYLALFVLSIKLRDFEVSFG